VQFVEIADSLAVTIGIEKLWP